MGHVSILLDKMRLDEMGLDEMGLDEMGINQWIKVTCKKPKAWSDKINSIHSVGNVSKQNNELIVWKF